VISAANGVISMNGWHAVSIGPADYVAVPTAIAGFICQFVVECRPPREWAQRLYNMRRWTPLPRGGHFAPAEESELIARDNAPSSPSCEMRAALTRQPGDTAGISPQEVPWAGERPFVQ
jgi:hypothetical protein